MLSFREIDNPNDLLVSEVLINSQQFYYFILRSKLWRNPTTFILIQFD